MFEAILPSHSFQALVKVTTKRQTLQAVGPNHTLPTLIELFIKPEVHQLVRPSDLKGCLCSQSFNTLLQNAELDSFVLTKVQCNAMDKQPIQ